jgi:hypothetical protein
VTDSRYADFDQAFAEVDAKPLVVRLFGRDWELPATISAAAVLKVARWMADGRSDQTLTTAEALDLVADLVPADVLKDWFAKGLQIDHLGGNPKAGTELGRRGVLMWLVEQYMADLPSDGAPGEAAAPAAGPDSSSNDGPSSNPTSGANTASTSPEPYAR